MKNFVARFIHEDQGQDLIEYAFLAVFIALAVTVGLQALASALDTRFTDIGTAVSNPGGGS